MTLAISQLNHRRSGRFCLSDISIEFTQPVTAMIGPNGAGKSTLLHCLANQLRWQGTMRYGATHVSRHDHDFFRRTVGFLPQKTRSESTLSVFEVVLLGLLATLSLKVTPKEIAAVERVLSLLELEELAERPLRELSGGQQQLVLLAQTLCKEPGILLLDEPLNNLDIRRQFTFLDTLSTLASARNLLVVIVLHDLQLAMKYAHRIAVLHHGRLHAYGPPRETVTPALLREVFGVEASIALGRHGDSAIDIMGPATQIIPYPSKACL